MSRHQAIGQNAQARGRMSFRQDLFERYVISRFLKERQATDSAVQYMIGQRTGSETGTTRRGLFYLIQSRLARKDSRPLFYALVVDF